MDCPNPRKLEISGLWGLRLSIGAVGGCGLGSRAIFDFFDDARIDSVKGR